MFDFIVPEFREKARAAFPEKIRGDQALHTIERTWATHDGRRLSVAIEERYKRDEQGRVIGIRSTVQDITERKRTEAALVASERRARILFEGIEDAVFVHAPDGRILDANPATVRLLGYTRDELLAMTTTGIDEPEFAAGYEERLKTQLTQGHLSCEEATLYEGWTDHSGRDHHLDGSVRRPARRTGRGPRHHRAQSAGGNAPAIRRGSDAQCPGDGGKEPCPD